MAGTPPPFRPSESSDTPTRIGRIESWATAHGEWARGHSAQAADDVRELRARLASLEAWKLEAYSAIGQIKVRLSFVMLIVSSIAGVVSAVLTAVLSRVLG